MKKKIIVFKSEENDISSVNYIARDLEALYRKCSADFEVEFYNLHSDDIMDSSLLKKVLLSPPDFISFIHPLVLRNESLLPLLSLLKSKAVTYIFHLYGDFLRQAGPVLQVTNLLKNERCLFLSPSEGYAELIRPLFLNEKNLQVLSFPVEEQPIEKHTPLLKDHLNVIYTGRISREKNVELIPELIKEIEKSGIRCKLYIAGAFDDFESSSIGNSPLLGEMYQKLMEHTGNLEVHLMGFLNQQEIAELYKSMDLFVSLSLYHDDDFGRAPIEALMHGLPCLLTDWQGYKDIHHHFPDDVHLLKTLWRDGACFISLGDFLKWVKNRQFNPSLQKSVKEHYSVEKIHQLLLPILNTPLPPFTGFSGEFMEIALKKGTYFYNQENYKKFYLSKRND